MPYKDKAQKSKHNYEYMKETCKPYLIRVNRTTEKDILDKIESQPNKIGFIKEAIRAYKAK